jgi:uncharacterized protein YajQ (UPF0234 family)
MTNAEISTLIGACGLVVSIVVLVFLVVQLTLLRKQVNHAHDVFIHEQERARQQSTLEFLATTLERRYDLRNKVPSEVNVAEVKQFIEIARADTATMKILYEYLNYWELLASGVNAGILDVEVVNASSGTSVINIWKAYHELTKQIRTTEKHPTLYKEIQELATTLQELRQRRSTAVLDSGLVGASALGPSPE